MPLVRVYITYWQSEHRQAQELWTQVSAQSEDEKAESEDEKAENAMLSDIDDQDAEVRTDNDDGSKIKTRRR